MYEFLTEVEDKVSNTQLVSKGETPKENEVSEVKDDCQPVEVKVSYSFSFTEVMKLIYHVSPGTW
jgi:hypothetical protein